MKWCLFLYCGCMMLAVCKRVAFIHAVFAGLVSGAAESRHASWRCQRVWMRAVSEALGVWVRRELVRRDLRAREARSAEAKMARSLGVSRRSGLMRTGLGSGVRKGGGKVMLEKGVRKDVRTYFLVMGSKETIVQLHESRMSSPGLDTGSPSFFT
jgi:hypothetical protein